MKLIPLYVQNAYLPAPFGQENEEYRLHTLRKHNAYDKQNAVYFNADYVIEIRSCIFSEDILRDKFSYISVSSGNLVYTYVVDEAPYTIVQHIKDYP